MSNLRWYTREFIEEFIELYRQQPCLWKIKSKEYINRDARNSAYEKLVLKLREVDKNATKECVIKRINTMRSSFRRELKKVQKSKCSGTTPDNVYTPTLFYFDQLMFTADQEIARKGVSTLDDDSAGSEDEDNLEESEPTQTQDNAQQRTPSIPSTSRANNKRYKRAINNDKRGELLELACSSLQQRDDEYDGFAKNVAANLRSMDQMQKLIVEKLICDLLLRGHMKTLDETTEITKPEPSPFRMGLPDYNRQPPLPTGPNSFHSRYYPANNSQSHLLPMPFTCPVTNAQHSASTFRSAPTPVSHNRPWATQTDSYSPPSN